MNPIPLERARQLAELLRDAGLNSGLLLQGGEVVLRSPGSLYTDSPTGFVEADLNNAIELGFLKPSRVTGSYSWDWYVLNGPLEEK